MITGAAGFSGSALVEHYSEAGWRVVAAYHNADSDRTWSPFGVSWRTADLLDTGAAAELVSEAVPDVIVHLAAQSSTSASFHDPLGTLMANAAMQHNLLEAARKLLRPPRVVVAGSCDEYGAVAVEDNPVRETQALRPVSPYALSKVTQDLMAFGFHSVYGLEVISARPFLQIGPRRDSRFVAGSFARQIAEIEAGLRTPIIATGNLDITRDFCDVRDVARAYALLGEGGAPGEAYNIATGVGRPLHSLLETMLSLTSVQARVESDPGKMRQGEAQVLTGDSAKIRTATGWLPKIPFEQSVSDTLEYWRARVGRRDQSRLLP